MRRVARAQLADIGTSARLVDGKRIRHGFITCGIIIVCSVLTRLLARGVESDSARAACRVTLAVCSEYFLREMPFHLA